MLQQFHWPAEKRCTRSYSKQLNSLSLKSEDPTLNLQKSFPHSLSAATMLKMGKLTKFAKHDTVQVQIEGFDAKEGWTVAKTVVFSRE